MRTSTLARRLRRLEQLHGSATAEDASWATHQEELPGELRELAIAALQMLAAARRAAGLPRPQAGPDQYRPPPEVVALIEEYRREFQRDLLDGQP